MNFFKTLAAGLAAFLSISVAALASQSVSIPGRTINCDGNYHNSMWMPTCPGTMPPGIEICYSTSGGGPYPPGNAWPSAEFTIWSAWISATSSGVANSLQVSIGLLGADGDMLTPILVSPGFTPPMQFHDGRHFYFNGSDRIDYHAVCSGGGTITINAAFEYTTP